MGNAIFFFQAEDGIRDHCVTGVQTCALPICVITPHLINDFHYSYLRNAWQWSSAQAPPQLPGLGGAIEIGADSSSSLAPYPVDRGSALTRFWDRSEERRVGKECRSGWCAWH